MRQALYLFGILVLAAMASPAGAQGIFDSIFGSPPRPPADVPSGRMPPPPSSGLPRNEPPAAPQPPPMNQPPQARPGAGSTIQTQPLSPIQGAPAQGAPPPAQAAPGQVPQVPQAPAQAGRPPARGTPQQAQPQPQPPGPAAAPPPPDEIVVAPTEQKLVNPTAVFAGLDKITGRTITFDVAINETVQFGALQVTPRVCFTRPPTEAAHTDAFVSVDEVTLQGETRRIFNGWMFAASPGLNAVEHPIYDVWLSDCKGATPAVAEAPPEPAPQRPQQQRRQGQAAQPGGTQPAPQRQPRPQQPNFLSPFR
ncbi:MAG: DUF2155 domain-containing protein [Pseudolabrys sp.]|nr:DUF2155 domain-containing protein [Pseudolabrys sp.]MBV9955697.1 DUF2155 domain-containing protein [Pseudolabrys sp.]